jgi:GT2 family glycosyltransferase
MATIGIFRSAARNTALERTETSELVIINADVVVDPNWLGELLATMNEFDAAVVGGRLEEYTTSLTDK